MKTAIVYYSRTGNTKEAAHHLEQKFKEKKQDVDLIEIQAEKQLGYLRAGRAGLKQKPLPITNSKLNMKEYDPILVGVPTWAGNPAPYYKSFFNKAEHIEGKATAMFISQSSDDVNTVLNKYVKEYLRTQELQPIDICLRLQMKKGEILDGSQNIDEFVSKCIPQK
jgi:flavodoxin